MTRAESLPQLPDSDATAAYRREWLLFEGGGKAEISGAVLVLGRKPSAPAAYPDAQLVTVPSPDRTVSRSHALLLRHGEHWLVRDLHASNGTSITDSDGGERPLARGGEGLLRYGVLLGEVLVRLRVERRA